MYNDKIITCKDCGQEFVFTANEQAFYAEKGFTNEPQRARLAVTLVRMRADVAMAEPLVRCSTPSAPSAGRPARFLSSPEATVLFTAATASATEDKKSSHDPGASAVRTLRSFFHRWKTRLSPLQNFVRY